MHPRGCQRCGKGERRIPPGERCWYCNHRPTQWIEMLAVIIVFVAFLFALLFIYQ